MANKLKYPNGRVRVEHTMSEPLYDEMHNILSRLPEGITRTDLINAFIKHGLSLSDKEIIILVKKYKG